MIHSRLLLILLAAFLIAGCASLSPQVTPTPLSTSTPTLTPTPDVCSRENLLPIVTDAHRLMREFDDISQVASLTPQSQLGDMVLRLGDVRRRTEDLLVPSCVQAFKSLEVDYMNLVIAYFKMFMTGGYTEALTQASTAQLVSYVQSHVGENLLQFRLQFNDMTTNGDAVGDMVRFGNGLKVTVKYTTP